MEPKPPNGYVISLARLHKRSFGVPAGWFRRALCRHYEIELHNFTPNAVSQAAVFVAVYEGYLGVPAHWDLWRHLFWESSTPSPSRRGCGGPFTHAASRSDCESRGRTYISPAR